MLQKLKKRKEEQQGFTIIEVLIVLAIAGLILLIVFLAVPALQRNARNTSRKSDISGLASAISEFVDNNNGQEPSKAADGTAILANWKPGYYATSSVTFAYNTTATATADPGDVAKVNVGVYSTCSGTSSTATNATARSVAITYDVETGGGMTEQCVTAQ